jgi:CheY-like chemotaxis protein
MEDQQALVLIADDEQALRRLAGELLTRGGFTVVTASDGEEAVAIVRRGGLEFDAVLLDMMMPHMSGAEACRLIRELRPHVPIVITSGVRDEDLVDLLESGVASGFVPKPFLPKALIETVRGVLRGASSATP